MACSILTVQPLGVGKVLLKTGETADEDNRKVRVRLTAADNLVREKERKGGGRIARQF